MASENSYDKSTATYEERNKKTKVNVAEVRFEEYARSRPGIKFGRMGFDEKNGFVDNFFSLHPILRNLPDYWYTKNEAKGCRSKIYLAHVKGTDKFKEVDYKSYCEFEDLFCRDNDSHLVVVFCFKDTPPITLAMGQIRAMWGSLERDQFSNDKKWYRTIRFDMVEAGGDK